MSAFMDEPGAIPTAPQRLFPSRARSLATACGAPFFELLAGSILQESAIDHFFIGQLSADAAQLRQVLLLSAGCKHGPASFIPLESPWLEMLATGEALCESGKSRTCPLSLPIDGLGPVRSLYAIPLFSDRKGIGVMAALGDGPCEQMEWLAETLHSFADRVGRELHQLQLGEKLAEQQLWHRTILDAVQQPVFVKGKGGTFYDCNDAFASTLGLSRDEIIGLRSEDFAPHLATQLADQEKLLNKGGTFREGASLIDVDGRRRELLVQRSVSTPGRGQGTALVGTLTVVPAHREAERKARYLACFDSLTNLPNQTLFADRLSCEIAQARRENLRCAVICLDLDHFKKINNAYGHASGDRILQQLARKLKACFRGKETISRMGGDSFNLLLTDIENENQVSAAAKRMLASIRQPLQLEGLSLVLNASLGIAIYPEDGDDAPALLKNADTALQQAKVEGRNTIRYFTPDMNVRVRERFLLENEMRSALDKGEFVLHFQPQMSADRQLLGAEALVRWQHPTRGLLGPQQFIGLAEETDLMLPLGEWVLRGACRQARCWQLAGWDGLRIAVNISPRQFRQADLFEQIARILTETELNPGTLCLELTEGLVMEDIDHTIQTLARLKKLGVHLAIDDFGTGYCSLSYLKNLPIDLLKIDRSFVSDIPASSSDMAIVSSVVALSHNLGLQVLAEGVQTEEQLRFLRDQLCDELQGFYLGKPMPVEAFAALLETLAPFRQGTQASS